MANEIIGLEIQVKADGAEQSVGSIRQQIKDANRALIEAQQNFGDYSDEAVAAAKRVAELKDRVQEAAETAALFDPGAKFKAFSGSLQAVAGGFAAVQGALGLVGVESEDLQKQLLKVQSALALSEGLSRISDSAKDFQRLGAVIQQTTVFQKGLAAANLVTAAAQKALGVATVTTSTGFKVLRGAIVATGIGALAIAVVAVIQNFDKLKAALLNAVPGLKTIADGIGNLVTTVTDFLGVTSEAERATSKLLDENAKAIRKTERELEFNADKYDQYTQRKIKANLDYRKRLEELLKDEKLTEQERNNFIVQARARADREIANADKERTDDAKKKRDEENKKLAADNKRKADERKQAATAAKQAEEQALDELQKLRNEAAAASIKDEALRGVKIIEQQLEIEKKRVQALKVSEKIKADLLKELEAKAVRDRQAIEEAEAKKREEKQKEISAKIVEIKAEIELAGIESEAERKRIAIVRQYEKEREDIAKLEGDKTELLKQLRIREQQELQALDNENAAKIQEKKDAAKKLELEVRKGEADTLAEERAIRLEEINIEFDARIKKAAETGESIVEIEKLRAQKIAELDKDITEKKKFQLNLQVQNALQATDAVSKTLGDVSKLVGEQTALGKTLAIAQAVIDTASSAIKAYNSTVGIPYVGPVLAPIAAATAVAFGVKNIKAIQATKIPGAAAGGGGGSVPNLPSAQAAPIPPQANAVVVGQTLNREAINRAGSAATRAYVVESDVTNSQERIKRIERAARLG